MNPKTSFILKNTKAKNQTAIILYISYAGKRLKYTTGVSIPVKLWNHKRQEIKMTGNSSFNKELKEKSERLNDFKVNAQSIFIAFKNRYNRLPTIHELQEDYDKNLKKPKQELIHQQEDTLFSYYEKFIKIKENGDYHRSTASSYRRALERLKKFSEETGFVIRDFVDIDFLFASEYKKYLLQRLDIETVSKEFKRLCTVMRKAETENKHNNRAYQSDDFKVTVPDKFKITLTEQEIKILFEHDFSDKPRLERVRDMFVLGCHTSFRISDLQRITAFHIREGRIIIREKKGRKGKRPKTLDVPFFGYTEQILKKYNYNIKDVVISTQKMNEYLPEVFQAIPYFNEKAITYENNDLEIIETTYSEEVGFHTSRRSFCTNRFIEGWELQTIMSFTKHTREATLLGYIKPTEEHQRLRSERISDELRNRKPLLLTS